MSRDVQSNHHGTFDFNHLATVGTVQLNVSKNYIEKQKSR